MNGLYSLMFIEPTCLKPLKSSFNKITLLIGVNQLKLFTGVPCGVPSPDRLESH